MLNFPAWVPERDSHSLALFDLFLLTLVVTLQWHSLHWEILNRLLSQFPLTFLLRRDVPFHGTVYDYSRADWNGRRDHLGGYQYIPWEGFF